MMSDYSQDYVQNEVWEEEDEDEDDHPDIPYEVDSNGNKSRVIPQQLKNPSVRQHAQELGLDANDRQAGVSIYYEEAGSPVKKLISQYDLFALQSLEQMPMDVVSRGGPAARVSDIRVPKENVVVAGGKEKKKREPPGTHSKSIKDRDDRAIDLSGETPVVSSRTKSKTKKPTGASV